MCIRDRLLTTNSSLSSPFGQTPSLTLGAKGAQPTSNIHVIKTRQESLEYPPSFLTAPQLSIIYHDQGRDSRKKIAK